MRVLTLLICLVTLVTRGNFQENTPVKKNQNELSIIADSISSLLSSYLYNPSALKSDAYVQIQKEVRQLAATSRTKEEFVAGFNNLWSQGPFSHVRLGKLDQKAADIANYIDSLRTGHPNVNLDWQGETALLTLNSMTGADTKEQVVNALAEIMRRKAKNLIIDLRNNEGGTFAGIPLMSAIVGEDLDVGVFASQKWWNMRSEIPSIDEVQDLSPWEGWSLKTFWKDVQENSLTRIKIKPVKSRFQGTVFVLISNKTASAAEMTADALANRKNVTLIGEKTAGEMLSQKMFDLPYGLQLSLPIADYYSMRTGRIEGKGVQPDIEINQELALEFAQSLANGETIQNALNMAYKKTSAMQFQPFNGATLYLFGSMNQWGKQWNKTPRFNYVADGIFETTTTFDAGIYEFKIAPMNWDFDFGAMEGKEEVSINRENQIVKITGSKNLTLHIKNQETLRFRLNLSNSNNPKLSISHI